MEHTRYSDNTNDFIKIDSIIDRQDDLKMLRAFMDSKEKYKCDIHGIVYSYNTGKENRCEKCYTELLRKQMEEIEEKERIKKIKIEKGFFYEEEDLLSATFDNYKIYDNKQKDICDNLKSFSLNEYSNFIILGNTATGKTHLACALVDRIIKNKKSCCFANFSDLSKYSIEKKYFYEDMKRSDFLIIDEYGRHDTTNKSNELFELMRIRTSCRKCTVIVSNLDKNSFIEKLGDDALRRRVLNNATIHLFSWKPYSQVA